MLSGIFVTLLGLITTFTLWCMIAAISDANAHVILRSSLGQYAISLPPRLVVTSLYIFLAWMCLFCGELVVAPAAVVLVTTVVLFFVFVIVVPLSALSRLILHTGAMAARPILSPALERQLLPTGLYASLLLRATHRQRCNPSNVTRQYQNQNNQNPAIVAVSSMEQPAAGVDDEGLGDHERQQANKRQKDSNQELSNDKGPSTMALSDPNEQVQSERKEQVSWALQKQQPSPPQRRRQHNRRPSEFPLPHASILNAAVTGQELRQLLELSSSSATDNERPPPTINNYTDTALGLHGWSNGLPPMIVTNTDGDAAHENSYNPSTTTLSTFLPQVDVEENLVSSTSARTTDTTTHTSKMMFRHHRRASSAALLLNEWTEDVHVRDLYGADMPADLIDSPPLEEQQQQQTDCPIQQQHVFVAESSPSTGPTFPHLLRESFSWWGNSSNHASLAQLSEDEIVAHPYHDNDEHDDDHAVVVVIIIIMFIIIMFIPIMTMMNMMMMMTTTTA